MRPIILPLLAVLLAEIGTALVLFNAAPHQPLGFWLWFGGVAAAGPFVGYRLYRHSVKVRT